MDPTRPTETQIQDILDIKDIIEHPFSWDWLWWVAYGLIGLTTVLVWWILSRRFREEKPHKKAAVLLDPHKEFFTAFSALNQYRWIEQQEPARYFLELSQILRRFIERITDFPATEATTEEITCFLQKNSIFPLERHQSLLDLLEKMDLSKFAKWDLSQQEACQIRDSVEQWVESVSSPSILRS